MFASFEEQGTGPLTSNVAEAGPSCAPAPTSQRPTFSCTRFRRFSARTRPSAWPSTAFHSGSACSPRAAVGELYLSGPEPTGKPLIYHRYLETEDDLTRMEAGLDLLMELSRQPALSGYCGDGEQLPASSDKADRRAYIRRHAQTLYHPVGTCAMGPDEDAVVDVELRVRGVDGLRVVDASMMPSVPRGNTNAPTIAVAERAADLSAASLRRRMHRLLERPQWRPARPDGKATSRRGDIARAVSPQAQESA